LKNIENKNFYDNKIYIDEKNINILLSLFPVCSVIRKGLVSHPHQEYKVEKIERDTQYFNVKILNG